MIDLADAPKTARWLAAGLLALVLASLAPDTASGASRIKDIVEFEGVRDNQLVGYGLVVGLNDTGDTLKDGGFTKQSLKSMLNRLGVKPTEDGLESKNVAAVMVTAQLPAFARQGTRIDVTVSALGDASDLRGRHASGDAADRRRRRGLRGGPGAGGRLRVYRHGGGIERHPRRSHHRAHRQRGHRRARGRLRTGQHGHHQAQPAQSRFHHGAPRRPGHQRVSRRTGGQVQRPVHRPPGGAGPVTTATWSTCSPTSSSC